MKSRPNRIANEPAKGEEPAKKLKTVGDLMALLEQKEKLRIGRYVVASAHKYIDTEHPK